MSLAGGGVAVGARWTRGDGVVCLRTGRGWCWGTRPCLADCCGVPGWRWRRGGRAVARGGGVVCLGPGQAALSGTRPSRPRAMRSRATSSASWRTSYAVARTTTRDGCRDAAGPLQVGRPLGGLPVEGTVDLEHQGGAVGEVPLAVGPPPGATAIEAQPLAVGLPDASATAQASYVELGARLGTSGDVAERALERLGPTQRTQRVDPGHQTFGGGQPLLDHGGEDPVSRARLGGVPGPQQHRGLEPAAWNAGGGRDQQVEGPPAPEEAHAVDGLEAELVVDEHGDLVALPACQPVLRGRGEAAQHATRTGVQHRQPAPLLVREGAGDGADHPRGARDPSTRVDVRLDRIPADPVRGQLATRDQAGLPGDQALHDVVHATQRSRYPATLPASSTGPGACVVAERGLPPAHRSRAEGSCA